MELKPFPNSNTSSIPLVILILSILYLCVCYNVNPISEVTVMFTMKRQILFKYYESILLCPWPFLKYYAGLWIFILKKIICNQIDGNTATSLQAFNRNLHLSHARKTIVVMSCFNVANNQSTPFDFVRCIFQSSWTQIQNSEVIPNPVYL